ncbi:MAG: nuclear transport factor 2 family protein [Rhodospirillales bacterium]|nr:nuclear transport factor 2 family protein [Rhodospirillales bacterium]
MTDEEAVLEANMDFYVAFARGDMEAMQRVWSSTDAITCIHPGWQALVGRTAVMESWKAILASPPGVRCVGARAFVSGATAHVICYEGLGDGMLVATNIFRKEGAGWRVAHHQAGPSRTVQEASPPRDVSVH